MLRRDILRAALVAFPAYALLAELGAARAGAALTAERWVERQQELALALGRGELGAVAWQSEVEGLAREVDLPALMAQVERSEVRVVAAGMPTDPVKRVVVFHDETGARRKLRYAAALFAFERG